MTWFHRVLLRLALLVVVAFAVSGIIGLVHKFEGHPKHAQPFAGLPVWTAQACQEAIVADQWEWMAYKGPNGPVPVLCGMPPAPPPIPPTPTSTS